MRTFKNAHNPILPLDTFIPDGEAHRMPDGRLYVYGSLDTTPGTYCSDQYRVVSTADMLHWTDHGQSFHVDKVPWTDTPLFAPDAVYHEGSYYLYFCNADGSEGVATSEYPTGPFKDATQIPGISGIDPAVFIDDDGQAYYYWGQFSGFGAKLLPNMGEVDPATITEGIVTEAEHGFHEGSCLRKRGEIYYLVYADISRGRPTCLGYATSSSPLGPFAYQGVIIDNTGCDPETWNNHGSIAEMGGQWYVFYHRSTRNSRYMRRLCVEPIHFDDQGLIPEVEMTSQGAGGPLSPFGPLIPAYCCLLSGSLYIDDCPLGGEQLSCIQDGDWAAVKYLDFYQPPQGFWVSYRGAMGTLEVRLGSPDSEPIASCSLEATDSWQRVYTPCQPVEGVHAVYLTFRVQGDTTLTVSDFGFDS